MKNKSKKIIKLANKAFEEKIKAQQKNIKEKYELDRVVLEKIIKFVEDRLFYKKTGDSWNPKYTVVTEEILLNDYANPAEYNRSTEISGNGNLLKIKVSGHYYYHIANLINTYEEDIKDALEKNQWEREKLYEKSGLIEEIKKKEPLIKKLFIDYQNILEDNKENL